MLPVCFLFWRTLSQQSFSSAAAVPTYSSSGIQSSFVKINKQKLHLKQSQVVRKGSSHTLPLDLSCRPSRKKVATFHPSGERKNFSLPGNSPTNERLSQSANEKSLHSELPLLYKRTFLSFVLRLSCRS